MEIGKTYKDCYGHKVELLGIEKLKTSEGYILRRLDNYNKSSYFYMGRLEEIK